MILSSEDNLRLKSMSDKSYRYPHGLSWFEVTVIRLLWVIAVKGVFNVDGNKRAYLRRLEKELFE